MRNNLFSLRATVLAVALAAASFTAHAVTPINAFFTFDNVKDGDTANLALGAWVSSLSFANPDTAPDLDIYGSETGTFHWIDASSIYGDVLVKKDNNSLSPDNVLWNDHQPILVSFSAPVNITRFSIAQDNSGFGNPTTNGSYLAFLDAGGHEIAGANAYYTQYGNLGLTIQNLAPVYNVSGVLIAGGRNYDNMYVNAVAVPEPDAYALMLAGLGLFGFMARRRRSH